MSLRRARSAEEYAEWVKQAMFEVGDLKDCLLYEIEDLQRFPAYIEPLEEGVKQRKKSIPESVHEIENKWFKLVLNNERATISGLYDKELQTELIDKNAKHELGEFIYELLDNRSQMEAFTLNNYTRESLEKVWFESYEEGQVWNTVRFRGDTKAAIQNGDFLFEVRLFNTEKRIDLFYSIEKKSLTDPEGIYIAFPFALENGTLAFDVQGGEIRAGIDQIPGSANDWNTVQNYARLYNSKSQIYVSSPEIPLMQFGGINTGRYEAGATPETSHIYAWPMNNYWVTNFNAEQRGGHTWSFSISSNANNSRLASTRFGWGNNMPFLSRVLPGGGKGDNIRDKSFVTNWPENIVLVSFVPVNDKSARLHVKEISGIKTDLKLKRNDSNIHFTVIPVNVIGEKQKNKTTEILPFESRFFSIEF